MKIAIDITPIQGQLRGHKVRGVGFYLENLKKAMLDYFPENEYIFFSQTNPLNKAVDIVHYPYFEPFFLTLPFLNKYKSIVTVHDLTPIVFPAHFPAGVRGNLRWHIQKFLLQRTAGIVTDSLASKKDIAKIIGTPEKKIDVAYLAAAEVFGALDKKSNAIKVVKEKYQLPEKFVLYVGDVTWNKNVPRLVEAIKDINLTLVMVGKTLIEKDFDKTNPWNNDLVSVQKAIENDKRFIRLGFVSTEDLVALYNAATVFVFPSVYEGFGLPILEAMQSGCPTVVTKESCIPEVAGVAGYYVDGYDAKSIASGIGEIFYSRKLQEQLSKKGLDQAKKFTWKKTAQDTISSYKKALST